MSEETQDMGIAKVAQVVNKYTAVINRGRDHGVRIGSKFLIYGIGDEIMDPETSESLGNLELVRGIGSATHVQDKMSTITSAKTSNFIPIIRTTKKPPQLGIMGLMTSRETIEEVQGERETIPFDGVKVGDYARPM